MPPRISLNMKGVIGEGYRSILWNTGVLITVWPPKRLGGEIKHLLSVSLRPYGLYFPSFLYLSFLISTLLLYLHLCAYSRCLSSCSLPSSPPLQLIHLPLTFICWAWVKTETLISLTPNSQERISEAECGLFYPPTVRSGVGNLKAQIWTPKHSGFTFRTFQWVLWWALHVHVFLWNS